MPARVTRSASSSIRAPRASKASAVQTTSTMQRQRRGRSSVAAEDSGAAKASPDKKIKTEGESDEMVGEAPRASKGRPRKRVKKEEEDADGVTGIGGDKGTGAEVKEEDKKPKTLADRKLQLHRSSAGKSPFPRWPGPSEEEADRVAWLLGRWHGYKPESEGGRGLPRFTPPKGEDKWGGCGDVKDVLEATVRTLLSCNTSGKNSSAAHASMTRRFGRNNWKAVLEAPQKDLEDALRCGGLANTKSKNIQRLLSQTQERYGVLSLQHLHTLPDAEVLETLISFQGVGPKVASCVLAFCLGRASMAVDTHVQRLSLHLGWVPPNSSREQTYYHLNDRVPPHLRYPLHVLLIQHGKACPNCRAKGGGGGSGGRGKAKEESDESADEVEKRTIKKEEDKDAGADVESSSSADEKIKDKRRPCPLKEHGLLGRKFKLLPEDAVAKTES